MRTNQVTIKDLAKELGISSSTVSRALKNHPDISPETKRIVNDLAKRLHYRPNAVALSLKNSKRYTIGVIIPETVHYFFSQVIAGIEDVAFDAGYVVMICQSGEKFEREITNAQTLFSNRVDGLLVSVSKNSTNFEHLQSYFETNTPLVFFDRVPADINGDGVIIDDYKAAYEATTHLIRCGYRQLCHFCAPSNLMIGKNRLNGFLKAAEDNGITIDPKFIVHADNFDLGVESMNKLIESGDIPDGIFAVNDRTALGVMRSLKRAGVSIPEQVGVVGFSNGQYSNFVDPALTTVDQNGYKIGVESAKLLIERINQEDPSEPVTKVVETHLVIRESTKSIK